MLYFYITIGGFNSKRSRCCNWTKISIRSGDQNLQDSLNIFASKIYMYIFEKQWYERVAWELRIDLHKRMIPSVIGMSLRSLYSQKILDELLRICIVHFNFGPKFLLLGYISNLCYRLFRRVELKCIFSLVTTKIKDMYYSFMFLCTFLWI